MRRECQQQALGDAQEGQGVVSGASLSRRSRWALQRPALATSCPAAAPGLSAALCSATLLRAVRLHVHGTVGMRSAHSTQIIHVSWEVNTAITECMAWLLAHTRSFFLRVFVGKVKLQGDWRKVLDVGAGCRRAFPTQRAGVTIGPCQGLNLKHK